MEKRNEGQRKNIYMEQSQVGLRRATCITVFFPAFAKRRHLFPIPIRRQPDVGISYDVCVGWKRTSNLHKRQSFRSTKQNRSFSFSSVCHDVRFIDSVSVLLPLYPSFRPSGESPTGTARVVYPLVPIEWILGQPFYSVRLGDTSTSRLARRQPLVLRWSAYLLFLQSATTC